jgi:hypothetical protein
MLFSCQKYEKVERSHFLQKTQLFQNPCGENRRDFSDFEKNRRRIAINRIW